MFILSCNLSNFDMDYPWVFYDKDVIQVIRDCVDNLVDDFPYSEYYNEVGVKKVQEYAYSENAEYEIVLGMLEDCGIYTTLVNTESEE